MSQVTLQGNVSGTGIFTIAAPNSNTNRTLNLPDAGGAVIVGTQPAGDIVGTTATQTLTNKSISGEQINSGTVAVARLGSGTPGSGNFLRGDGSWQTVSTTPTTDQVLTATAGASAGAVGTYCMAYAFSGNVSIGGTMAGNQIQYSSSDGGNRLGSPAGTWRVMGYSAEGFTTVYLRIS
jgi:hypothetical protein